MNVYDVLKKLDILYEEITHPKVHTIEEAERENIASKINGVECKNLFVKNKNHYYLIVIKAEKHTNLKELSKMVNEQRFTFASTKELKEILNLEKGSVTPLGIINDKENKVILLFDKELENNKILVHPNINTKTISIQYEDLIKIIEDTKHKYYTF